MGNNQLPPFFLLRSEHKHCDNVATDSNSGNTRSRMVASLRGSVGTGTKEDESSTGCVLVAGFHHVIACSHLVCFENYKPFMSLIFQILFGPR